VVVMMVGGPAAAIAEIEAEIACLRSAGEDKAAQAGSHQQECV
jgi:hypothetical protein